MSPGHTIGCQMLAGQTFCCGDGVFHSWFLSFSLSHYEKKNDMFHENNVCVKDQLISCSPALWVSVQACDLLIYHNPCYWLRSISFDHRCLITWLSFLKGLVQSYVWWGKATFGVTVWSSTWWCVNRWVGELLSGMMVFEATPEEAWADLSAINFPDVQVRHHGCFCG